MFRGGKWFDVDGNEFVHGDRMSKRQYYSHGGPGWDFRFSVPEFNLRTDQVENDEPWPPTEEEKRGHCANLSNGCFYEIIYGEHSGTAIGERVCCKCKCRICEGT